VAETKADKTEAKAKADEEPKFPRERIIAEADVLLGESRGHVVAGAISDVKGTGPITLADARKAIDSYRKRDLKGAGI